MRPESLLRFLKIGVGATWIAAALAAVVAVGNPIAGIGRLVLGLLFVVHSIECLLFLPALRGTDRPLSREILETLIFGAVHYASLRLPASRA